MNDQDEIEIMQVGSDFLQASANISLLVADYMCAKDRVGFLKGYGPELYEEAVAEKAAWVDYKIECLPPEIRGKIAKTFGAHTHPTSGYRQSMAMFFIKENGQWRTSGAAENKWKDSPQPVLEGSSTPVEVAIEMIVEEFQE